MQFPYKIYQARNSSAPAYVYLGKAAIAGYYGSKASNFPHQVRKDCQDIFLFATIKCFAAFLATNYRNNLTKMIVSQYD